MRVGGGEVSVPFLQGGYEFYVCLFIWKLLFIITDIFLIA